MSESHKGRCLCGAIQFEFTGDPNWVAYCHCDSCRRNTASPTTVFIGVNRDRCHYRKGETTYYESSPGVRRHFCGTCGTPLSFDADRYPEELHLYLVNLENPEEFRPQGHVYTSEQLNWFEVADDLKRYPKTGDSD